MRDDDELVKTAFYMLERGFKIANLGFCFLKIEWYLGKYKVCFEALFVLHSLSWIL